MPCPCHAPTMPFFSRSQHSTAVDVSFPFDLHSAAVSDSHLPCHAHAMHRPCRSSHGHSTARPSMCLSHLIYTVRPCLIHTCHAHAMPMPCSDHAVLLKATARPSRDGRAVLWPGEERHGRSMAWALHGKCESVTAALCKSNGKDTF